ncbi:1-acyl-sn-glycerol-3-phosphate acyltransferase [Novosphingobium flavum]|uniref:lysophospholipid acyltransferase family protein n=1 Tax=Novosphingobium aerophilum TaxID=2839843 RepID=UPI00163B4F40|nr:lysophospholipid acyltransferase family protein [Novosphingobium aerophilum]MBC2662005.1 1-acyl-sn-glycerol-3-phosphate acyltransferase [Novosphingobium aerophilum]
MTHAHRTATTAGHVLRSILYYVLFYGGSVLLGPVVATRMLLPGTGFVQTVHAWTRWHRWCVVHVLGIAIRVEGPVPSGPLLVALKHESLFEALDLPVLLDRPAVFAKMELLRVPAWGKAGRRYGLIGVERDQGAKALRQMIAEARQRTAEGRVLAIFPEGTRVPHGRQPPLQSGFAGVYKLLGLPVVPVALDSGALFRGRWKRRGTITYRFGETIPPGLPREEIEARVHAAINALNPVERA